MIRRLSKKTICLAAAAITLTGTLAVGSASAYFTTYSTAKGSVKFNMGRIRDITNEEEEEIKQAAKNAVREALANSKPNATSAQKEEQPTKEDNAKNSEAFPF